MIWMVAKWMLFQFLKLVCICINLKIFSFRYFFLQSAKFKTRVSSSQSVFLLYKDALASAFCGATSYILWARLVGIPIVIVKHLVVIAVIVWRIVEILSLINVSTGIRIHLCFQSIDQEFQVTDDEF